MLQTLPFDNVLPHLHTALEPCAMKEVFSKALLSNNSVDTTRFRLESCDIGRVKYKPGKNCMIYYTLHLRNNITHGKETQLVCARFYPQGDSASRYEKAKRETLVKPSIGEAILHVPELEMVLWAFPNDRKLQHVTKLMDDTFLQEALLPSVIAAQVGREWKIAELNHELVHYAPEHTCTVRAHLRLRHTKGDKLQTLTLYGKTYYNNDGAETYRLMQLLWNGQSRKQGLLNTAKPLSYHPEYNMLWQQGLNGQPLITLDIKSPEFKTSLKQVARTVATLHQTPLSCNHKVTREDWQKKLVEVTALVARVKPEAATGLESLANKLLEQAKDFGKQPKATLHGDLHLQNFLIDNGTISLIDLDNLCQGSPWQDIGSFIAALYYRGLLENIPTSIIDALSKIFYDAYALASTWKIDEEAIRWYTATSLINERAFRTITRLKAGRLDILDDLLGLASRLSHQAIVLS
jgi:thiamine kinase-like enzyme